MDVQVRQTTVIASRDTHGDTEAAPECQKAIPDQPAKAKQSPKLSQERQPRTPEAARRILSKVDTAVRSAFSSGATYPSTPARHGWSAIAQEENSHHGFDYPRPSGIQEEDVDSE